MSDQLAIFEDNSYRRFLPLSYTRPTFELLCGAMTLRERIERQLGRAALLYCRSYLSLVVAEHVDRPVNVAPAGGAAILWVNGRILDPSPLRQCQDVGVPCTWWNGDELVAARLDAATSLDLAMALESNDFVLEPGMLPGVEDRMLAASMIDYPWELALANADCITRDFLTLPQAAFPSPVPEGVHVLGSNILVGRGAKIDAGAALDARNGPILIGSNARISAHTRVEGPAAVGSHTRLMGGKIRGGTTIGPFCRVGGEVEESIFHGYSNKYHDGFIGHSYVGEWVNLGALTTNSDLKNTYGSVRVWNDGQFIDTGESKVGTLFGDHVKTGIGTLLDTGTVVGVAASIFGGGLARSKFIPSFTWGSPPDLELYDPQRCVQTMEIVMGRRDRELTDAHLELVDTLYRATVPERVFAGMNDESEDDVET